MARQIRRPPATSTAPTIPSAGSAPPVLGRTFVPPAPLLPEPGAIVSGEVTYGVVVPPRFSLKLTLALKVSSLAGRVPKSLITLVGLQGLAPLLACTIWTGNDTGSALSGGTGPGGNLGTSKVPVWTPSPSESARAGRICNPRRARPRRTSCQQEAGP